MTAQGTVRAGDPIPLQNIDSEGVFPSERVPTAQDARTILSTLTQANRERARVNALVKGMIDGNRPYDPVKLRNAGQANVTNVNWLEGGAKLSGGLVPYYDLFSASAHFMEINVADDFGTLDDRIYWGRILTEEADKTFKAWEGFDWNIQTMLCDFVAYGKGILTFKDEDDWRFGFTNQSRVLFPDGTESDPDKWEVLIIRQAFRVNELANFIRNKESAKALGWNVKAVEDAIFNAVPQQPNTTTTLFDYNFVQQMVKDHDIMQGMRCKTVQASNIYVREFSGKVSHLIVTESNVRAQKEYSSEIDEFIFKSVGKFDKFSDVISPFIFEVLDGSINGTQGLGHKIYGPMQAKNRLICASTDLAMIRSGIALQANTAGALQKLNMVQIGRFTVIPPDFAVQQSSIMGDMDSPLKMNRALDILLDNNTGIYRNEGQKEEGNPRTFGEVKLQFMNSAVLANSAVNRFFGNLDRTYNVCGKRLCNPKLPKSSNNDGIKAAVDFQKRCAKRGVPKEVFDNIGVIRAYRPSGNGSPFMRQQSVMSLGPIVPMFPESGKQRWLQDAVAVAGNQQMVERYVPQPEIEKLPTDQMNMALLEDAAIKIGAPVTWTPTQNNVVHLQTHLGAASQAAATLSQGAQPADVLGFLQGIGAHCVGHLQALQGDPMRQVEFKALSAQWNQLAKTTDDLAKHVQEQQAQQQKDHAAEIQAASIAAGMDPETKILAAQAQQKMQINEAKTRQQMGIKQSKSQHDMAIKEAQAGQQIALADATTAADIQRQAIELQHAMNQPTTP